MTTQELNDLAQRVAAILREGGTDVTNLTGTSDLTNFAAVCVDTSGNIKKAVITGADGLFATKTELNAKASTRDLQIALAEKADKQGDAAQSFAASQLFLGLSRWKISYSANELKFTSLINDEVVKMPSTGGTLALTNQLPTKTSDLTNDSNYLSENSIYELLAVLEKAVFVKLWQRAVNVYGNTSFGSYDGTKAGHHGEFVLNGIDLDYDEAVTCFIQTHDFMSHNYKGAYRPMKFKTNLPVAPTSLDDSRNITLELMFANNAVQKLVFRSVSSGNELTLKPTSIKQAFQGCSNLQTVEGHIDCSLITDFTGTFGSCAALVDITLINVHASIDFSACPNISYDTLNDIVEDRNDGRYINVITIKVHSDVWSKMQDQDNYPNWFGLKQKGLSQAPYYIRFTN